MNRVLHLRYQSSPVNLFVIEPQTNGDLVEVVVRYRANEYNKSMMLNVGAMTWRESSVRPGDSLGIYVRSGDQLDFRVEYHYQDQSSIVETFVVRNLDTGVKILLPVQPNMMLRALLGALIVTTIAAPYLIKPKDLKSAW